MFASLLLAPLAALATPVTSTLSTLSTTSTLSITPLASTLDAADGRPLAPDGRPGFGREPVLGEILRLFRTPDEAEQAFLDELAELERSVAILVDSTKGAYRSRGYFDLIDGAAQPTLGALHDAFRRALLHPDEAIERDDAAARAFARMHLDTRFRVRMGLLEGWEHEAEQLRDGVAVLAAAADGFVVLSPDETENVALRVDLAASILRALYKDLEALREQPGWPAQAGPTDEAVRALLDLRRVQPAQERTARLSASMIERGRLAAQMHRVLFSARLDAEVGELVAWRVAQDARARAAYADAWLTWPDREGADEVTSDVRRLSRTDRRQSARDKALAGLAYDPLDAELAYLAGVTSRIVHGSLEAASHYDRYLTLHGIRYADERTYRRRDLTWEQKDALLFVQQLASGDAYEPEPIVDPTAATPR